jgi:Matrixin
MTRRTKAAVVALSFFTLGVGLSADAFGFCRSTSCADTSDYLCARDFDNCKSEGSPLYWDTSCVGFSLQEDASEFIDIDTVRNVAAFAVVEWTERECPNGGNATLAFSLDQEVACAKAEYNDGGANANVVLFQDFKWAYTGVDNTLAKTTVTYDTDSGEILDADMEINHAYNEYTVHDPEVAKVVYDLQSIMTHEFGHFIGMDHTEDFNATMNAGYQEGTIELRTIEDDDIAGLCAAYPPGGDAKCIPSPKGGLASECGGEPVDPGGCHVGALGSASDRSWPWLVFAGALGGLAFGRARQAARQGARR